MRQIDPSEYSGWSILNRPGLARTPKQARIALDTFPKWVVVQGLAFVLAMVLAFTVFDRSDGPAWWLPAVIGIGLAWRGVVIRRAIPQWRELANSAPEPSRDGE